MANKYVDHSATYDGDGTAPTQAAGAGLPGACNTLAGKVFSAGDVVWIRRKDKVYGAILATTTASIVYVGWPKSGDDYYATRPAAGTAAGWDADADDYATVKFTNGSYYLSVTGSSAQDFHRIKAWNGFDGYLSNTYGWRIQSCSPTLKNCYGLCDLTYIGFNGLALTIENSSAKLYGCVGETKSHGCTVGAGIYVSGTTGQCELYDCIGKNTNAAGSGSGFYIGHNCLAVRCTGQATAGTGIYISAIQATDVSLVDCVAKSVSSWSIQVGSRASIRNLDVQSGMGYFSSDTSGARGVHHLKRLTQTVAATAGIYVYTGQCILHADNVTFNGANGTSDIVATAGSLIILRNATFASATAVTGTCDPGVFSFDHQGTVGNFKHWGKRGTVVSSAVYRDGGQTTSLKLQATDTATPRYQPLVQIGLDAVALTAGAHTITVYGAHKSYGTPPTKDSLFFELDYLDEAGAHRALATSRDTTGAALAADASTWNGDSGLTVFKTTLTITLGQPCTAAVRALLNQYDAAGFVYLDPKPIVT